MFLAETWANEARLKKIKRDFDFSNMLFVDRNNVEDWYYTRGILWIYKLIPAQKTALMQLSTRVRRMFGD